MTCNLRGNRRVDVRLQRQGLTNHGKRMLQPHESSNGQAEHLIHWVEGGRHALLDAA